MKKKSFSKKAIMAEINKTVAKSTQRDPSGCHHNTMHIDNGFFQISFVLQQILIHLQSFWIQVNERRFSVISANDYCKINLLEISSESTLVSLVWWQTEASVLHDSYQEEREGFVVVFDVLGVGQTCRMKWILHLTAFLLQIWTLFCYFPVCCARSQSHFIVNS